MAISNDAYRQLRGKLDLPFADAGEKALKNIVDPVRIWLWPPRNAVGDALVSETPLALPDKPSIAVLPFDNLSGDQEQEYFADGMTEDIITGLSRFRSLFVTARNSTFSYKGKSPDVRDVARDLGVRYILEGSVRRGGSRIRITGQLIDAEMGSHIWVERYDRDLDDIFAVQDEVTDAIVAAIAPEIDEVERERAQRKPPDNLDAWGLYQRALASYYATTEQSLESAIDAFDSATEIDPRFAPAYAMAADARVRLVMHYRPENTSVLLEALKKARSGSTLDSRDSTCLWSEARAHTLLGNHITAISKAEEALDLNPNSAIAHYVLGFFLGCAGRPEEAIPHINDAMRLSPRDIFITGFFTAGSAFQFLAGHYEKALEWSRRASECPNPRPEPFRFIVAALVKLGRRKEAEAALATLMGHEPGCSIRKLSKRYDQLHVSFEGINEFLDALREAGLPE